MFTPSDLAQLQARGISVQKAEKQLQSFATGFPELDIVSAASVGNGVLNPTEEEIDAYVKAWQDYLNEGHTVLKFVPASGAASRMFKDLFEYLETGERTKFIDKFLGEKEHFAFANQLAGLEGQDAVSHLLKDMNYGNLPKGLLLFHSYEDGARTPALEHLVEGAMYAASKGEVNIHFTVSHEHLPLFQAHLAEHQAAYEEKLGVKFHISYSEQKPSTDTLAANPDGTPFRTADGKLLFRPGGHGALIENLNEQEADVIFIKNIDNVVPDHIKGDTVIYKKVLAGILVSVEEKIFNYLNILDSKNYDRELLNEIAAFLQDKICCRINGLNSMSDEELAKILYGKLNRPVRVCGMVKNVGEPGGGPFLAYNSDGSISLQILESSQIDMNDSAKKEMFTKGTHFNPVDLVCGLRGYKGDKFNLPDFVDQSTGFISSKSKSGRELKALELPGLWNGAMSNWNTLFVEVPLSTFNPVKTVNDLLREQHQPS